MTRYVAYSTEGAARLGAWIGDEIVDLGPDPDRLTDGLAPLAVSAALVTRSDGG